MKTPSEKIEGSYVCCVSGCETIVDYLGDKCLSCVLGKHIVEVKAVTFEKCMVITLSDGHAEYWTVSGVKIGNVERE